MPAALSVIVSEGCWSQEGKKQKSLNDVVTINMMNSLKLMKLILIAQVLDSKLLLCRTFVLQINERFWRRQSGRPHFVWTRSTYMKARDNANKLMILLWSVARKTFAYKNEIKREKGTSAAKPPWFFASSSLFNHPNGPLLHHTSAGILDPFECNFKCSNVEPKRIIVLGIILKA